jgi:predicted nucleotidyltransferase
MEIEELLRRVCTWAESEPAIAAVALVGSHARGTARPDSDIDLVVLTRETGAYLNDLAWTRLFGEPSRRTIENWGIVSSVRVWYADGPEVEFGIAGTDWGADPTDEGTTRVIRDGIRIVCEKGGLLSSRLGGPEGAPGEPRIPSR